MVCLEMISYYCAERFKKGPSFTTFVDMPYFLKTVKPRKIQAAYSNHSLILTVRFQLATCYIQHGKGQSSI